jgi:hypothetical protein
VITTKSCTAAATGIITACPGTLHRSGSGRSGLQIFDLAEKYRSIGVILLDGTIGQMIEPAEMPPMREIRKEIRNGRCEAEQAATSAC